MVGPAARWAQRRRRATLTDDEQALLVDPWYHDFRPLGLATLQRPGIFAPNQAAKQGPLFDLLDRALSLAEAPRSSLAVLELFCADGFYSLRAAQQGVGRVVGVDTDAKEVAKARLAAKLLGLHDVEFRVGDVFETTDRVPIAICAGGLYHVADPERLLRQLRGQVTGALVVQTVYHLGRTEADYFETPAPGWTWGCRFSADWLLATVERAGWQVRDERRNELTGNDRPEDRGSAYLLCTPA